MPTIPGQTVTDRLHDLRNTRNEIERAVSGLRPSDDSPSLPEWEETMGRLARMHAGIGDLLRIERERDPVTVETPYGKRVTYADGTVMLYATHAQLADWSHRPGAHWPCSELARCFDIAVKFDPEGDLVDMSGDDEHEIPADELNAWSDDVRTYLA